MLPANVGVRSVLLDVGALSARNAWAVGAEDTGGNALNRSIVEHWNGHRWTPTTFPPFGEVDILSGISAVSANDIWAVGSARTHTAPNGDTTVKTVVLHYDGTAWRRVKSANSGTLANSLSDVAAISARDVVAVGEHHHGFYNSRNQTLAERYDGTSWSLSATPNPGHDDGLVSVDGNRAGDVWVAGSFMPDSRHTRPLILRLTGSSWRVMPKTATLPSDLEVFGPKDVWMAGRDVEHWNGSAWATIPT
jgi:hypothetical protein